MKTPTLETERLILRPLSMEDIPNIIKYFNNWNIIKYTQAPWPYDPENTEEHIRETIEKNKLGEHISWAITIKDGEKEELIGRIDYRDNGNYIDRGFWLAEHFHGKGLMTEAAIATQDYIFFEMKVDKVIVENMISNTGSRRVQEKTGCKLVGVKIREDIHIPGEIQMWEITRESWTKIRSKNYTSEFGIACSGSS